MVKILAMGSVCQWSMLICEGLFVLTYTVEFRSFILRVRFENKIGVETGKWQQPVKPSIVIVGH